MEWERLAFRTFGELKPGRGQAVDRLGGLFANQEGGGSVGGQVGL